MTIQPANLEQSVVARAQRADRRLRRILRITLTVALIIGSLLFGLLFQPPWAPRPAHAAIHPGTVHVCTTGIAKSWTKGLQRKANKAFHQRIRVHRVSEDGLTRRHCDVVVWRGGRVALDYITGEPAANPYWHVYTGPYAMADAEINVGTVTPKGKRPAELVKALRAAGVQ